MIPNYSAFRIKSGQFIRHGDDPTAMPAFLRTDAHRVSWYPQNWSFGPDGGMVVSATFDSRIVVRVYEVAWDPFSEILPVAMLVWEEEPGQQGGFL